MSLAEVVAVASRSKRSLMNASTDGVDYTIGTSTAHLRAEWTRAGREVAHAEDNAQFWIDDLLNYGRRGYGEKPRR